MKSLGLNFKMKYIKIRCIIIKQNSYVKHCAGPHIRKNHNLGVVYRCILHVWCVVLDVYNKKIISSQLIFFSHQEYFHKF